MGMQRTPSYQSVSIESGQTESAAIELTKTAGGGIVLPSSFDGASLSVLVSPRETGAFVPLVKAEDGTPVTMAVAAGQACPWPPEIFGFPWAKLVAATQVAARLIEVCQSS